MDDLDKLTYQEILDRVVAVALGEKEDQLPPTEELMAKLDLGEPIATESVTWPVDPDHLDPESFVWHLEKHASAERCAEIANGAALTTEERVTVIQAATKQQADSGIFEFVRYYRVTDSKGRSVYFSEVSGDDLGSCGPSSCHHGPMLKLPYAADTHTQLEDGTIVEFYILE
jgi:hypothetical protein